MPTTIHPFPELRAYAESEAHAYATTSDGQFHEGVFLYAVTRLTVMLCDLTRPASRDAVARLVVAKLGGPEEGADAGGWWEFERWDGGCLVRLYSGRNCHELWASESVAVRENGVEADAIVPDMAGCQTLASALSAIVAHLWPSE